MMQNKQTARLIKDTASINQKRIANMTNGNDQHDQHNGQNKINGFTDTSVEQTLASKGRAITNLYMCLSLLLRVNDR